MTFEQFKAKQQDKLVRDRSQNEINLKQWMEYYKTLPQSIRDKYPIDINLTYESACPEAYKENPDQAIYDQQHEALVKMFEPINAFANENNRKVEEDLRQAENELTK